MNIDNQNDAQNLMDLNNHYSSQNVNNAPAQHQQQASEQQLYNNPYFSNAQQNNYAAAGYVTATATNGLHHIGTAGGLDISELNSSLMQQFTNGSSSSNGGSHDHDTTNSNTNTSATNTPTKNKSPTKSLSSSSSTNGLDKQHTNGKHKKSSSGSMLNKSASANGKMDTLDEASPLLHTANKRRKKDPKAPKAPLNGYLVYFNEERVQMRQQHPNMSFGELTKIIAVKWKELQPSEKQKYITEAELDKERYVKEMEEYKQSDAYKVYLKEANAAKVQKASEQKAAAAAVHQQPQQQQQQQQHQIPPVMMNGMHGQYNQQQIPMQQPWQPMSDVASSSTLAASSMNQQQQYYYPQQQQQNQMYHMQQQQQQQPRYDIPIFSDNFLEHNKQREGEMRQLRKEISELEQQNSVLNKHIDNMKQSIVKIEKECEKYKLNNDHVQKKLDLFRHTMLKCFSNLALPHTNEYPTEQTIDDYIYKLFTLLNSNQNSLSSSSTTATATTAAAATTASFVNNVKSLLSNFNSYIDC